MLGIYLTTAVNFLAADTAYYFRLNGFLFEVV